MSKLVDLVKKKLDSDWAESAKKLLAEFAAERYGAKWDKKVQIRVNGEVSDDAAPFAAFIPAGQPKSGPYGGMSFVLFPSKEGPSIICLGIGTNGLSPDEQALSRPGHARKALAISRWLNQRAKKEVCWAKADPVRIDISMPKHTISELAHYESAIGKYGKVLYAVFMTEKDSNGTLTESAAHTLCDVFAEERGLEPLAAHKAGKEAATKEWMSRVIPSVTEKNVAGLLDLRRFVIVEGPPGTGKTRMATEIIKNVYQGRGMTIQFHPGTTYESFVGGLAPINDGAHGLQFAPRHGQLMNAVSEALKHPDKNYLLHIDEINRADLAKVLGEAIFLLEPSEPNREVNVFYDFGAPSHSKFKLPKNLHILGTMNSADRSIAILDVAVRRRFAFVPLWPSYDVLTQEGASETMKDAFHRLFTLFVEEAPNDAFALMPGHAYFLDKGKNTGTLLNTGLKPLLSEYIQQGYVSGFADEIRAYIEWISSIAE